MAATQNVRITTSNNIDYSTVVKKMIDAANACKRLRIKGENVDDKQRQIINIADWAYAEFKKSVI